MTKNAGRSGFAVGPLAEGGASISVESPAKPSVPNAGDLFGGSSAVISPCRRYRYRLDRSGYGLGKTAIIMVNPSTADAERDDATIRKLKGFGRRNAWGDLIIGNLFAFRATDVRALAGADDAVGPDNDAHLKRMVGQVETVIYAWGPTAKIPRRLRERWREVDALVRAAGHRPYSIGAPAADGQPKHPLMLAYDTPIVPWEPPAQGIEASQGGDGETRLHAKHESPVAESDAPKHFIEPRSR